MERGPELLRMTIYGQPYGAGSKTARVVTRKGGIIVWRSGPKIIAGGQVIGQPMLNYGHASKFTEPWMKEVAKQGGIAWAGRDPLDGPLWLDAFFYESRPSGHYLQRKAGRVLRPDAPAYPESTETHDVDKMRRAISDALKNGGVIVDDKRIVGGEAWKDFVENAEGIDEPLAMIRVGRMDFATVEQAGFVTPAPADQVTLSV